ncbi:SPOR domain-containing protein [uncultured Photobacterium sp.]|uniref:SPOR domain-containing protein n=1 Tax=uncultured Photobacterium sp. TaxID=173973 RepID=UPI00260BD5A9|nr:SPOR domain-containing protein [uncultured Photobacterium sp.]
MICTKNLFPPYWLLLSLGSLFSYSSLATEQPSSQCQIERSASEWQFLNSQCDIGTGLWGRKPKENNGSFWLQCNYSKALPNKLLSKAIHKFFPHNSYLIPDNGKYRCVIGPFQDHELVKNAQQQFAKLNINKAFVRQTTTQITVRGQTELPVISAPTEIKTSKQNAAIKSKQTKSVTKETQKQTDKKNVLIENRVILNSAIYSFTFNNLKYHLPMTINSTQEMPPMFIREHNQYWSKVNFATAENWCQHFGLRLPTIAELQYLHTHGQHFLLRHRWPIKANFWSNTVNLYSGEIRTMNIRSGRPDDYRPLALHYTTCVTEAS